MKYLASSFPLPCTKCGRVIQDAARWEALELVGDQPVAADPDDPDDPAAYTLELRNCACGTTLSVRLAPES